MRVSASIRIQWLHEELIRNSYPNAACIAERFHISRRQAQRDIQYLKRQLGAPLEYDGHHQGYRYRAAFSLPFATMSENDEALTRLSPHPYAVHPDDVQEVDNVVIQSQIPYTAILSISDRLTVLEMRSYIISEEEKGRYLCEFRNIDRFLCAILTARSAIRIVEPSWLRDKLIHLAKKAIENNS